MTMIALSSDQVFEYLRATFYRPSVYADHSKANEVQDALTQCKELGLFKPFVYDSETKNIPYLLNVLDFASTPQGIMFWTRVHSRIINTAGYDKPIISVFTPVQLKVAGINPEAWVQNWSQQLAKKGPLKNVGGTLKYVEDPDETREII